MYRRSLAPARQVAARFSQPLTSAAPRRLVSTAPPAHRSRTWKNSALRWGLAAAAVYWYNTSPIFAEEPASRTIPAPPQFSDADFQTVDAVIEEKRLRSGAPTKPAKPTDTTSPATPEAPNQRPEDADSKVAMASPEVLEEEADQQGAFNPETGEINWDCPCLGGMADGPCGEEFKAAFSCFVYSKEEPKGMDCIEKFQGMQECFRQYPEIYGAELSDDEADEEAAAAVEANPLPPARDADEPMSEIKNAPKTLPEEAASADRSPLPASERKSATAKETPERAAESPKESPKAS